MKQIKSKLLICLGAIALISCGNENATSDTASQTPKRTVLEELQLSAGVTMAGLLCLQNMQRKSDIATVETAFSNYTQRNMIKLAPKMNLNMGDAKTKELKNKIDKEAHAIAMELIGSPKPTAIKCNGLAKRLNAKEFDI